VRLTDKVSVKKFSIALLIAVTMGGLRAQDFVERVPTVQKTHRVWARRVTFIAACAASLGFDALTTRAAVVNGGVEGNPMFAGAKGSPSWGRVIGVKLGIAGVSGVLQETHMFGKWKSANADWTWSAVNAGTASVYTWAGFHNLELAK
jgi:hypothetical protein